MKEYPVAGGNAKGQLFRCPDHHEVFGPEQKHTKCYACAGEEHPDNKPNAEQETP